MLEFLARNALETVRSTFETQRRRVVEVGRYVAATHFSAHVKRWTTAVGGSNNLFDEGSFRKAARQPILTSSMINVLLEARNA